MQNQLDKSLLGTNFLTVAILLAASIVGGMQEELAGQIAVLISGIIGAFGGLRNWFKGIKLTTGKSWIGDPNNWAYLSAVVLAVLPKFADFVPAVKDLANAIISGNWSSIITAGLSLLTMIYYLVIKNRPNPTANLILALIIAPAFAFASCNSKHEQGAKIQAQSEATGESQILFNGKP